MPSDRIDDDPDLTFSGLAKDFPEFKKKVNKKSVANEWDIITDMAQVVAAVLMVQLQNKSEDDDDDTEPPKPAADTAGAAEGSREREGEGSRPRYAPQEGTQAQDRLHLHRRHR
mmetsp:Transcript_32197/g.66651  ORF Transcript_32197/g.66651 Transcript_32197/m.66651 type:complete len:114 (+) Transcript_32197:143-484(+)